MKTLAELRAAEKDLVARAAAKAAEIKDDTAPEALRALEAEHDKLLEQIEQVRGEIAQRETAERTENQADILKADRERGATIRKVARQLGLPEVFADEHVERGTTANAFRGIAIDEMAKRQADPNQNQLPPNGHRQYAAPKGEKPKGTDATRALVALAASHGSKREASDFVSRHYGPDGDGLARALSTSIGSAGGFLVPDEMAAEVIELLRPASAVMSLGPRILPMPRGNIAIPRIDGGASANYIGENQPITASQQEFGMVQLQAKKLAALVPVSNDMIRFPTIETDGIVRDDMVKTIAMRADLAFIRGGGTQFSPRGLKSWAADPAVAATALLTASPLVGSSYAALSQTNTIQALASVTSDLSRCELSLENANIKMIKPGWIFSPRTKQYLMNIRDGLGNQVYYAEMSKGMLRGKPFAISTQVLNNLATVDYNNNPTLDGSEVYLADFSEVFVGEAYGLEFEVFPGAAYIDSTGTLQSGVSNDQTVMRAIVQHDLAMRQMAAVAYLSGVRWY